MSHHAVDETHEEIPEKKILVLTTTYPADSDDPSGVFIAKLLKAIRVRGYRIKVLAPSSGAFYGRSELDGIETVRFGYFWPHSLERLTSSGGGIPENMAKSVLAKLQVLPMMVAFVCRCFWELRGMDVIYANWLGAGIVGACANLITRKPLVISFRGDDGYLARDRFVWRVLTKWAIKRAAITAPVSRELRDVLVSLGAPAEKFRLPRFGVDTAMFHPPADPRPLGDTVSALFVGSLIMRKGLQDLIVALAAPEFSNVRLTVVGEGVYGPELKALAEENGLKSGIRWLGVLPPYEVARLMREHDLLCLPSYMEGRPNVVNEALASGLPVISTRIGGIPDMVVEGRTALLHGAGDIGELRACLKTLVDSPKLRADMGTAARELLISSGVSWDSTAEDFDHIFSGVLASDEAGAAE